jgi:hypothetical protein
MLYNTQQTYINNLFDNPYYTNQFNALTTAKQNGSLTSDMLNGFYNDISYGVINGSPPSAVPIDMDFIELFILFSILFLPYFAYKRFNNKKP